jgi:hypothetical protein
MLNKDKLCEAEVRKNIVLVETGQPLTLPLATLNRSCEFRKVWEKWSGGSLAFNLRNPLPRHHKKTYEEVKAHRKAYGKAHNQKPEVKAHRKAHRKAYNQKPEVKAHRKAYNQKPEVKAHIKAYHKAYYQKHKLLGDGK